MSFETKLKEEVSVSEIADIFIGGTPKTSIKEYWDGDIFWASAKDVANCDSRYLEKTEKRITQNGVKNSAAKILPKDTIVITSRGTVGKICLLPFPMSFNQTCYGLVVKKGINPLYLFYKLKSMLSQIDSLSYGTVFDTITKKTFDELKFSLPLEHEQRAIASILGSLDDKIALNRSMNSTLEAIGQAIFKHWFVDFEFPNEEGKPYRSSGGEMMETELGEVPRGWKVGFFTEIADVRYGFPFQSKLFNTEKRGFPIIRIRDLPDNFTDTYTDEEFNKEFVVKAGDFVVGMDGEFRPYIWQGVPSLLNQRICSISGKKETYSKHFLRFLLREPLQVIESGTVGTTVIHLSKKDFDTLRVIIPQEKVLSDYNSIYDSMLKRIINNFLENLNLSGIRDALLPKLMSGEVRVTVE